MKGQYEQPLSTMPHGQTEVQLAAARDLRPPPYLAFSSVKWRGGPLFFYRVVGGLNERRTNRHLGTSFLPFPLDGNEPREHPVQRASSHAALQKLRFLSLFTR